MLSVKEATYYQLALLLMPIFVSVVFSLISVLGELFLNALSIHPSELFAMAFLVPAFSVAFYPVYLSVAALFWLALFLLARKGGFKRLKDFIVLSLIAISLLIALLLDKGDAGFFTTAICYTAGLNLLFFYSVRAYGISRNLIHRATV